MTLITVMLPSGWWRCTAVFFAEDGDALFLLQVTGVHQALDRVVATMAEGAGLAQHRVDERRLAMIDVSDDGYVAKVRARIHVHDCRSAGSNRENGGRCGRKR